MSLLVTREANERFDCGEPFRVVARGLLDTNTSVWIGAHPGFTDVIDDTGVGDNTVHLVAAGAATMYGRAVIATTHHIGHCAALAGATLQDLQVLINTDAGVPGDGVVFVEVLETAV